MQGPPDAMNRNATVLEAGKRTHAGQLVPDLHQTPQRPIRHQQGKLLKACERALDGFTDSVNPLHPVLSVDRVDSVHDLLSSEWLRIRFDAGASGVASFRCSGLTSRTTVAG